MPRKPRTVAPNASPAQGGAQSRRAGSEQSPSALAWEWYLREYNRLAAELSAHVGSPLTLGALARGRWFPPPTDAQRAGFFARLVDELAPLAGEVREAALLMQRSIQHANETIDELCRLDEGLRKQKAGLALGPAARSARVAKIACNGRDTKSLYYRAALDYALQHPDAGRDVIVAFLERQNLPAAKATTIRRYIAGVIESARTLRAQAEVTQLAIEVTVGYASRPFE
jgi:hypothetical protein